MRARGRQGSRAAAGPPAARGRRWMPVAWSAARGGLRFRAAPRRPVRSCAPLRARAVPALRPCACCMRPAIPASRRPPCAARPASGHAGTARRPPRSTAGRTGRRHALSAFRCAPPSAGASGLGRRVRHAGRERAMGGIGHACRGAPASGCGAARGQRRRPPIPGIPPRFPTASVQPIPPARSASRAGAAGGRATAPHPGASRPPLSRGAAG